MLIVSGNNAESARTRQNTSTRASQVYVNANLRRSPSLNPPLDDDITSRYEIPPLAKQIVLHSFCPQNKSNEKSIKLRDLALTSSGQYKCEVSTEAPSFDTTYQTANLTVICEYTFCCLPSIHVIFDMKREINLPMVAHGLRDRGSQRSCFILKQFGKLDFIFYRICKLKMCLTVIFFPIPSPF